ncbi:hypothetical protein [Streptomyces sp. NPDC059788]|uniref:hypothetical protein n=1 Tax=Streptomyces sp. NPDC059788 TaxID=3346948 RepID=UPI00365E5A47
MTDPKTTPLGLTAPLPAWIPRGAGLKVITDISALGVDAVCVPRPVGQQLLAALGLGSGAVIEDNHQRWPTMTWLVPLGTASGHQLPPWEGARPDGQLYVPGLQQRSRRLFWRLHPEDRPLLTDPAALRDLLPRTSGRSSHGG